MARRFALLAGLAAGRSRVSGTAGGEFGRAQSTRWYFGRRYGRPRLIVYRRQRPIKPAGSMGGKRGRQPVHARSLHRGFGRWSRVSPAGGEGVGVGTGRLLE